MPSVQLVVFVYGTAVRWIVDLFWIRVGIGRNNWTTAPSGASTDLDTDNDDRGLPKFLSNSKSEEEQLSQSQLRTTSKGHAAALQLWGQNVILQ